MEFSEVSELNSVIGALRLGTSYVAASRDEASVPSHFLVHDSRDSEVDRLFNSSPPLNVGYLDDYSIDDMSSMKYGGEKGDGSVKVSASKSITTVVTFGAGDSEGNDNGYNFCKEEVPPLEIVAEEGVATEAEGELSRALNQASSGEVDGVGEGAPSIALTIYFPDRSEMRVEVFEVCTVEEAIGSILRSHKKDERTPTLYYTHTECYELRLHEGGGEPDTDFPALDRGRKIKHFGDAGDMEFVLCEIPSMCPPEEHAAERHRRMSQIVGRRSESGQQSVIKIIMPYDSAYTILPITAQTRPRDLLPQLMKKHRLQRFTDEFVFHLTEPDQLRLNLITGVVEMTQQLQTLGVEELELRRKIYADAPQLQTPKKLEPSAGTAESREEGKRPDLDSFMFNEVSATAYKEWNVVKTNKFGKKQNRIMGVDRNKIYNKKHGDRGVRRMSAVMRAERLITNITKIYFLPDDECSFRIVYSEGNELNPLDYSTETPYQCAEVVAKIKYNMRWSAPQQTAEDHLSRSFGATRSMVQLN